MTTFFIGQKLDPGMFPVVEDIYRIDTKIEKRWYVIQTAPRAEEKAAGHLADLGLATYLPKRKFWGKRDKRTQKMPRRESVLMPGYLLAEVPVEGAFEHVCQCHGVTRFVEFQGSPAPLASRWIDGLRDREANGSFDETRGRRGVKAVGPFPNWIFAGAIVRIADGPFASFVASVVEAVQVGRVKVEAHLFGRVTPMDLELAQLEKL